VEGTPSQRIFDLYKFLPVQVVSDVFVSFSFVRTVALWKISLISKVEMCMS
jgi:hypothetical protein